MFAENRDANANEGQPDVTSMRCWPRRNDQSPVSCNEDELFHLQADGFWGPEGGFHDAEARWQHQQD
jgi:hypothetical protein